VKNWLSFYAGYHYSERRIEDIEDYLAPTPPGNAMYEQKNHLQAGLLGVRIKPLKAMIINLESEVGRANQPFTPVSDRNYQSLGGRFEYRVKKLTLGAVYRENYNNNSVTLSSYSSHARNYSANASWAPRDWFTLDASYSKLHLDSLSGIVFFAGPAAPFPLTANQSYISNIHAANLGARFVLARRVDLLRGLHDHVGYGRWPQFRRAGRRHRPHDAGLCPGPDLSVELPIAARASFHPAAREVALERRAGSITTITKISDCYRSTRAITPTPAIPASLGRFN
jgi:hypothetical protein